jgi:hypothetical protein
MEEDRPDDKLYEAVKKYLTSLRSKFFEGKSTRTNSPLVVPPYAPYQNLEKLQLSAHLSPHFGNLNMHCPAFKVYSVQKTIVRGC